MNRVERAHMRRRVGDGVLQQVAIQLKQLNPVEDGERPPRSRDGIGDASAALYLNNRERRASQLYTLGPKVGLKGLGLRLADSELD